MKLRRTLALVLTLTTLFTATACNDATDTTSDIPPLDTEGYDGFPIAEEPVELTFFSRQTETQADFNDVWFFKALAEASNIHITFDNIATAALTERRNLSVLSDNQPDVYFKAGFSQTDIAKYSEDGLFVPIDEYFDEEMPNFTAVMDRRPDVRIGLTMPDGHIYSTPYILDHYAITTGVRFWFNGDAMEAINSDVPETIDDLTEVLHLLKDYDLNGNGIKDEIPLTSQSIDSIEAVLLGSWGLGTRGSSNDVDIDSDGNLRYIYTSDEYREAIEYMAMLYKEELLDQDIFTTNNAELIAKGGELRAPVYAHVSHVVIGATGEKSLPMQAPFEGPHGDQAWRNTGTALGAPGSFLITNQNEHVVETIRWLDYLYSDSGIRNYFMGIQGDSYESEAPATYYINDEGSYEYVKYVVEDEEGRTFLEVLGNIVPWGGGNNPSVANEKYFKGGEMQDVAREAADNLQPYLSDPVWPALVWETDEIDDMSRVSADIASHRTEGRAAFITGTIEITDDTWEEYIQGFDDVGLQRYMEIYRNAVERYELD